MRSPEVGYHLVRSWILGTLFLSIVALSMALSVAIYIFTINMRSLVQVLATVSEHERAIQSIKARLPGDDPNTTAWLEEY